MNADRASAPRLEPLRFEARVRLWHTIGVAVEAEEGQAIALARMVAAKLRTGTPPPD